MRDITKKYIAIHHNLSKQTDNPDYTEEYGRIEETEENEYTISVSETGKITAINNNKEEEQ